MVAEAISEARCVFLNGPKLRSALARIYKNTGKNLPILGSVLIGPNRFGQIGLTTTDLRACTTVCTDMDDWDDVPFQLCLDAMALFKALAGVTGDVTLERDGTTYRLLTVNSAISIPAFDPDEFPVMPETHGILATVWADDLLAALRAVVPAASTDSTRGVLTGISMEFDLAHIRLIASDAYRLHVAQVDRLPSGSTAHIPLLLPARSFSTLITLLDRRKYNDKVTIRVSESGQVVAFRAEDGATLLLQAMTERFVNWRQIVPKQTRRVLAINRDALLTTLTQMRDVMKPHLAKKASIVVRLGIGQDRIVIEDPCEGGAPCHFHAELPATSEPIDLGINLEYLVDVCQIAKKGDTLTLAVADGVKDPQYHVFTWCINGNEYPTLYVMPITLPR